MRQRLISASVVDIRWLQHAHVVTDGNTNPQPKKQMSDTYSSLRDTDSLRG